SSSFALRPARGPLSRPSEVARCGLSSTPSSKMRSRRARSFASSDPWASAGVATAAAVVARKARRSIWVMRISGVLGAGDVAVDDGLHDGQRHAAGEQDRVVELADVEARAERDLRLVAQPQEGELAHHVAAGLARPDGVALDLLGGEAGRIAIDSGELLHRL